MRALIVCMLLSAVAQAQVSSGTLTGSSAPNATWTWQSGVTGATGDFYCLDPHDGSPAWGAGLSSYANATVSRRDNVFTQGWNCGSQGQFSSVDGHLCENFESYYEPGNGFPNQMEWYLGFAANASHPATRFLSFNGQLGNPYQTELALRATTVSFGSGNDVSAPVSIYVTPLSAQVTSPDQLKGFYAENAVFKIYAGTAAAPQTARIIMEPTAIRTSVSIVPEGDDGEDLGVTGSNAATTHRFRVGHFSRGIRMRAPLSARQDCNWETEGQVFTARWETGQRTKTFQCCISDSGVPAWALGVCQ